MLSALLTFIILAKSVIKCDAQCALPPLPQVKIVLDLFKYLSFITLEILIRSL